MSEPYEYIDHRGVRLTVGFTDEYLRDNETRVSIVTEYGGGHYVHLPPSERTKAIAAMAGDDYRVVPVGEPRGPKEQQRRPFDDGDPSPARPVDEVIGWDDPEPIDPKGVKVGDVVSASFVYRDTEIPPFTVEGETYADQGTVKVGDHAIYYQSTGTPSSDLRSVRVVRPAPDPAEDEIAALAETLDNAGSGDANNLTLARELHARNVRVVRADERP